MLISTPADAQSVPGMRAVLIERFPKSISGNGESSVYNASFIN
jgi:hypothetical protein